MAEDNSSVATRVCSGGCGRPVVSQRMPPEQRPPGAVTYRTRGLCESFHYRARTAGTLTDHERLNRSRDEVMDDYRVLVRERGLSRRDAADRMHMSFPAFDRAIQRARRAGEVTS